MNDRQKGFASPSASSGSSDNADFKSHHNESFFQYVSPTGKTGADTDFTLAQYETHWGKKISSVKSMLDAGESLAHVLFRLRPPLHKARGYNRVAGPVAKELICDGQLIGGEAPLSRLGVTDARYSLVSNFDPLHAVNLHAQRVKNIVEFGAGPGWNLFKMAIYIGKKISGKRIFGMEYTNSGIEMMNVLNSRELLPLHALHFDYTKPDISMIPDDGATLFFSHHSIEQVEDISSSLYDQIKARKSPAILVHIEPIGWQRFPWLVEARVHNDISTFRTLATNLCSDLHGNLTPAFNAALNSWRVGYNRNALALIKNLGLCAGVSLNLELYDFNHQGNWNPVNPSTYIELQLVGN